MSTNMPNPADQTGAPEAVAEQPQQPVQPEAPPPALFERTDAGEGRVQVRLNTGEVFTGTPDELVEKLAQSAAHTHNYGRRLKGELDQVRQQAPPPPPQQQAEAQMDPAELMIANIAAKSLGFRDAAHQRQEYERLNSGHMEMQGRMVANQFMSENPDFAPSEHNSRVLIDLLHQNGMQETPQTMAMAHNWAKMNGMYEQVSMQPRGAQFVRPVSPPQMPTSVPSSAQAPVSEGDLWSMPAEKLAQLAGRR